MNLLKLESIGGDGLSLSSCHSVVTGMSCTAMRVDAAYTMLTDTRVLHSNELVSGSFRNNTYLCGLK